MSKATNRPTRFRIWITEHKEMMSWDDVRFGSWEVSTAGNPVVRLPCLGVALDTHPNKMVPLQYTGFTDDEGVEIYEGDVVDGTWGATLEEPAEHYRIVVQWDSDGAKWVARDPFNGTNDDLGDYRFLDRVVGNVYQNPGLIDPS